MPGIWVELDRLESDRRYKKLQKLLGESRAFHYTFCFYKDVADMWKKERAVMSVRYFEENHPKELIHSGLAKQDSDGVVDDMEGLFGTY